jgi:hypothetical protein
MGVASSGGGAAKGSRVSPELRAAEILDRWRALERELARLNPESIQAQLIRVESRQLRDEYQKLVDGLLHGDEPLPDFPVE